MRSFLRIILPVLAVCMLSINSAYAQLTAWRYSTTIDITENRGSAYTQYPILLYINTASLITNGQMQANGADMRFAQTCSGNALIPYYIESGINTDSTKVWIRVPQVNALNVTSVYFFTGNPTAAAASNFSTVFPNAFIASSNNVLSGAQNYDWFEVPAGDTVFVFAGAPLDISASRIIINGVIDGNGAGNAGGVGGNGSGLGGGTISGTADAGSGGGSYAGIGGTGGYDLGDNPGVGGATYGTASGNDIDMGSGGGGSAFGNGGNGGGAVTLNGYDITLTGAVIANGDSGVVDFGGYGTGGGSGGGLEAIAEHLRITGTVSAAGGAGGMGVQSNGNDGGGGGSGGRIKAFYYANATLASLPNVAGGAGGTGGDAADGTAGGLGSIGGQQLPGAFGITVHALTLNHTSSIASGTDSACVNSTNTYTASAGAIAYQWRAVGGTVVSGQGTSSADIRFTVAGTDSVVLVTTNNVGCTDTVKMPVIVNGATPAAAFSTGSACTGLITQFTDASTGTVSGYNWAFGDGGTSTDRNPVHTYAAAGTYSVTLTVSSAFGCSNSTVKNVTVDNAPVAAFTGSDVCLGTATTFNNTSTGAATYAWNFGDNVGSSLPQPTHTYAAAGTYDVMLVATSINGCADSVMHQVSVSPKPTAAFTAADVCQGSATQFVNGSTIASGVTSFAWTFGDGGTSTDINPSHTYAAPGLFAAKLVVTSGQGCVDSVSHLVHVNSIPQSSYVQSSSSICLGDSVRFVATTVIGTIRYSWTFGDGGTSNAPTVTHTYSAPSTYTVTLTVFDSTGGCSSSTSSTVTVFPHPMAAFTATTACQSNATQFSNTSSVSPGTFSSRWTFGDGGTSTDINPTHIYAAAGNYTVKLTITTNTGCTDTISHTVAVNQQPISKFGEVSSSVCNGTTVQFVDSSTTTGNTAYHWYFGDGDSSSLIAPSHTYASSGSYLVVLTLMDTVTGCSATSTGKVEVFAKPSAAFSGTDVCLGSTTQFTNASTINTGSFSNVWDFGDTTTGTDINPTHTYQSIGIKTVLLMVTSNNGCSDTITHTVVVNPLPVPDFSPTTACFGQAVNFTNLTSISFGTNTYAWDFGDGTSDTATNPSHVFPALGSYTVKLTATSNSGCVKSVTKSVTIQPNPSANFSVDNVCNRDSIQLVNLSSVSPGTYTSFWEFGDGNTSVSSNPSYSYANSGSYTIKLIVTSNHGCTDSATRNVIIYPTPFANFISNDVCIGEKTVFQSISSVTGGGFISDVKWDFGDGDASVSNAPIHEYANPGNYVVRLTATSNQGCRDSITKAVVVHALPTPDIRALGPVAFCMGDSVTLSAGITGTDHYRWSTGDTTQNITVKVSGMYSVTVTSQFGCKDSDAISIVAWSLPIANAGNDTIISKGYVAHLHATGGVGYVWSPIDSTIDDPTIANPTVKPMVTTVYTVVVTDSNGCKGTDSVQVTVLEDFLVEATNVITPNGDGKNDFWMITNVLTYPTSEVLIFDRLGNKVFESKAYHNEWDGKYKGKDLPEGTYYYVIKFDGNDKLYKGAVSILR